MTVSDLRNKFSEVEAVCLEEKKPIVFTKNGRNSMVLIEVSEFNAQQEEIDKLNEALAEAYKEIERLKSLNEIYGGLLESEASINRSVKDDNKLRHTDKIKLLRERITNAVGVQGL
jgi:prevent-host-death family protein